MKDFKEMESIEVKDFGIRVNPYLTYAQVQAIANSVYTLKSWAEREQNIDMLLLIYATNLTAEEVNNYNHEHWLKSGLIDCVKANVLNFYDIEKAIKYEESPMRTLMKIANEMPEFSKKLNGYLEVAKNANSKK